MALEGSRERKRGEIEQIEGEESPWACSKRGPHADVVADRSLG